jgi:hypothetical protein
MHRPPMNPRRLLTRRVRAAFAAARAALLAAPLGAAAHPGHGLDTPLHAHASDAWGYAALAAVVAAGVWLGRRK